MGQYLFVSGHMVWFLVFDDGNGKKRLVWFVELLCAQWADSY